MENLSNKGDSVIYQTEDGLTKINVTLGYRIKSAIIFF